MPQPGQLTNATDPTSNLIAQFEQTVAEQNSARVAAESTAGALQWNGQAAVAYRNALATWTQNLDQVRQALLDLQGSMSVHAQRTATTEDDNLQSVNIVSNAVSASASWT